MKKLIKNSVSVAVISLLSASAISETYFGASVGQTDYTSGIDTATSLELKGGFKFNEYFGLEAAYVDLGDGDFEVSPGNMNIDGFKASVVGFLPVGETVDLYGKIGLYTWDADVGGIGDDDSDISYGVGVAWGVADNLDVNLGYDIYDFELDEASNVNLGLTYSF